MQRLYAMFPDGRPGLGLALLRLYLGLELLAFLDAERDRAACVAIGMLVAAIVLGLLVPVWTLLFAMLHVWLVAQSSLTWAQAMPPLMVSLAMLGLGPGAYSLDARLFGRRVVVVHRPPRQP